MPEPITIPITGKDITKYYEGFRDKIYIDTKGNPTIGYGFNLADEGVRSALPKEVVSGKRPLKQVEAEGVFNKLYTTAQKDAIAFAGQDTFGKLDPQRRDVLIDMSYNLGLPKLSGFKRFRQALQKGDYDKAAVEMKDSDWYHQTGRRAKAHYKTMMTMPMPTEQEEALFGGSAIK